MMSKPLLLALMLTCVTAHAAMRPQNTPAPPPAPAVAAHQLTASDVEAFLDGFIPYAIARDDIVGCTVSVVENGQLLFAKGYGFADLRRRAPVSAETTLFRPGSISKLFTWTAVMQLVEQGKLDLDTDINRYLDFKIPERFGRPITLRQLMTHSAGFEDTNRDLFVAGPDRLYPLDQYLKRHVPAEIYPPGKYPAYSNYGAALAGYIVQRVSGEHFEDYIARHILQPLGMTHSTFEQPVPRSLPAQMSTAYDSASDGRPRPFEVVEGAPAGALSASATDIARFMIAHLQDGRYGNVSILQPRTAQEMHSHERSAYAGFDGMALGFYEESRNGMRIIGHAGDTAFYHSDLALIPDAGVGLFISLDGGPGSHTMRLSLLQAFMDRYFPQRIAAGSGSIPDSPPPPAAGADAQRVAGWYLTSAHTESALRVLKIFLQTRVMALPNGEITIDSRPNTSGAPKHWREVRPLVYREVGGSARLAFATDARGRPQYWISSDFPPVFVYQRVRGLYQRGVAFTLLAASIAVLVATLLIWAAGPWVRTHYRSPLALGPSESRLRVASRIGAALQLVMLCGWILFLLQLDGGALEPAVSRWIITLSCIGVAALLGAAAMISNALAIWATARRGVWVRLGESVVATTAVYLIWLIFSYGLADFGTRY